MLRFMGLQRVGHDGVTEMTDPSGGPRLVPSTLSAGMVQPLQAVSTPNPDTPTGTRLQSELQHYTPTLTTEKCLRLGSAGLRYRQPAQVTFYFTFHRLDAATTF